MSSIAANPMIVRAGEAASRSGWAADPEVFLTRLASQAPEGLVDELTGLVDLSVLDGGPAPVVLSPAAVVADGSL